MTTNTNSFAPALAVIPIAAIAAVGAIVVKKIRNKKNDDSEVDNNTPEWALENVECTEDTDTNIFKMAKDICHLDWTRQNKLGLTPEDFDTARVLFAHHILPMEEIYASIEEAKCLDPMIDADDLILWAYEVNRQRIENVVRKENVKCTE